MRPGPGFSAILDEHLARAAAPWTSTTPESEATFGRPVPPAFLFTAAPYPGPPGAGAAAAYRPARARMAATPRQRTLTASQARALECLRSLGVPGLDASFTETELKSAFRSLARTLHPDRHLEASEHERQYLSRCFARACDAYRELSRVFVH